MFICVRGRFLSTRWVGHHRAADGNGDINMARFDIKPIPSAAENNTNDDFFFKKRGFADEHL